MVKSRCRIGGGAALGDIYQACVLRTTQGPKERSVTVLRVGAQNGCMTMLWLPAESVGGAAPLPS